MQFIIPNITDDKIIKAVQAIGDNGGTVHCNRFEVRGVVGYYNKDGDKLIINISSKPWLATWDMIELKINEFFGNGTTNGH